MHWSEVPIIDPQADTIESGARVVARVMVMAALWKGTPERGFEVGADESEIDWDGIEAADRWLDGENAALK